MMDYSNLITPQHRVQPKFMAWLSAALNPIQDTQNLLNNLSSYYDIDRAVGAQLDSIGVQLGTSRKLPFQPSNSVSPVMDDTNYRLVLKAIIAEAHFDGTMPGLYQLFQTALGNTGLLFAVKDNQDMTLTVYVYGKTSSLIKDELEHGFIVPRPEGVAININVSENKIFAWGIGNEMFSGWGSGHWLMQGGVK